jgi:hypothetical protein
MDEMTILREAFGPDEVPPVAAQQRARAALLQRTSPVERVPVRAVRRRWPLRVGLTAAVAAAAVIGVVAVENVNTVETPHGESRPVVAALPYARPADAKEFLENAAWTAARKPWTPPRPDQFMYKESLRRMNNKAILDRSPNGPLVPGKTSLVKQQAWTRIDDEVVARYEGKKLIVNHKSRKYMWMNVPYRDLAALDTPEKVLAWEKKPGKAVDMDLDAVLGYYVLPPAVEAAIFRAIAQRKGARLNPDTVNLDGRPAVGLRLSIEGYLSEELLFDKQTYALIGERLVATANHKNVALDGTSYTRKGDVFRQVIYTASRIVDEPGRTR